MRMRVPLPDGARSYVHVPPNGNDLSANGFRSLLREQHSNPTTISRDAFSLEPRCVAKRGKALDGFRESRARNAEVASKRGRCDWLSEIQMGENRRVPGGQPMIG